MEWRNYEKIVFTSLDENFIIKQFETIQNGEGKRIFELEE